MGKPWSDTELDVLYRACVAALGQERPFERIARRLPGRTAEACRQEAQRQGWYRTSEIGPDGVKRLNLRDIARLLNRHHSSVLHWVKNGTLPIGAHRSTKTAYAITEEDLWAWLENPASWHCWEPETLRDLTWREHFTKLRRDWLPTTAVAERLMLAPDSVTRAKERLDIRCLKASQRAMWWNAEDVERVRRERVAA